MAGELFAVAVALHVFGEGGLGRCLVVTVTTKKFCHVMSRLFVIVQLVMLCKHFITFITSISFGRFQIFEGIIWVKFHCGEVTVVCVLGVF